MDDLLQNYISFTNPRQVAILEAQGEHNYHELDRAARAVAANLLAGRSDLQEACVVFMVPPGFAYAAIQRGIWLAGGIALPLCLTHPLPELAYVFQDVQPQIAVASPPYYNMLLQLAELHNCRFLQTSDALAPAATNLPKLSGSRRAMILYTSGTTSKPKGVVLTHANLMAQMQTLLQAWCWRPDDHVLHVLPLHHTHGIINVLGCALSAGATCEFLDKFEAARVWERFSAGKITLFMAVPTMYARLIAEWEKAPGETRTRWSQACAHLRLMVSGSAALPVPVFEKWLQITGHTLLERYGMTEIGMALSNPLHGERRAGTVGMPLPGVAARLVNDTGEAIAGEGVPGEIQISGANVFREYWNKPEATRSAFRDGWFCTGDVAVLEEGYYRILGRSSMDIIKTGGYKVSALEIESILLEHEVIKECAVVGVPDEEWGERVCTVAVFCTGAALTLDELRAWGKERMAIYKIPSRLCVVDSLPRNAMGKVVKQEVKKLFGRV
jgi:malonyl-CoA/methylmalonyl-CoA synthetase